MKLNVYQVNPKRDSHDVCFRRFDSLRALRNGTKVDASIYDRVFSGEIDGVSLEDAFYAFNVRQPDGYSGRSMSVSDVVEVVSGSTNQPGYYYCDSFRWVPIQFDPSKCGGIADA